MINYRNIAPSIDEFIEKYPDVTLETFGEANSPSTCGDTGSGHFGTVQFGTIHFKHKEYYTLYLVKSNCNAFWYDEGVEIGIQFKYEGETLFVRGFVNGWIYSGGAVWRSLDLGLTLTSITFVPKSSMNKTLSPFETNEV